MKGGADTTIIYYRSAEGRIVAHHKAPDMTPEDLKTAVDTYNGEYSKYRRGGTAHIAEVADDGLEAYLCEKAEERFHLKKQCIRDALDALEQAEEEIRSLDVWKEN